MRTVKRPDIRRQQILDGAIAVFLEKGYEKSTIGDIAGELGISQGLCYRYYSSKEDIYEAVIDHYADQIAKANLENRPQNQPIREWIDHIPNLLEAMEQAELEGTRPYMLFHRPQNRRMHMELCMRLGEKLLPAVTFVLERAKAMGEIHIDDCEKTAAFGIYGEIGLLASQERNCSQAIRENWRRLLGLK